MRKKKDTVLWVCRTAVFMALNIAVSAFGIPVPGGHFYLSDLVICVAALSFQPLAAFMVGGVGSMLGDMLYYPVSMFVSLAVHGLQAVAISFLSHHTFHRRQHIANILAVTVGAVIMVVGYTAGKAFVYSTPEYAILKLPYEILQAAVGAVGSVLLLRDGRIAGKIKS